MKQLLRSAIATTCLLIIFCFAFTKRSFADVTLATQTVAAANLTQNSNDNIVYVVKMDVTVASVTVNNIQFTLGGTYDNNDLTGAVVYFNPTTPSVTGGIALVGTTSTNFAAPHTYNLGFAINQPIAASSSGYFIIVANLASGATPGNTIKVNGLTNPVVFGFSSSPVVTNNQTDLAGIQTIVAAAVTLSSSPMAAANIAQGAASTITYAVKMDVTIAPVTINNIQFTLGGTYDNNDLSAVSVYFNATTPTLSGATVVAGFGVGFAAPHTYSTAIFKTIAAGSSGYFIIVVDVSATATAGNTIKVDGLANPVVFGFATGPTVTNNQTDAAGVQTIIGGAVTLSSSPVAAANIAQGAGSTIAYVVKMDVTGVAVTANNMQFTLGGTYDNNDLSAVSVYFNATAPTLSGATAVAGVGVGFTAPHTYSTAIFQPVAAGSSGYFIIVVDVSATATAGNTIKVDGLANPVVFGFATGPTVTNNQTDAAGVQTIIGGAVTLSSSPVAAANIAQGAANTIAYVVKMDVTGVAVTSNNMQFTLGGTYDNNDLSAVSVYFNATAPTLSGATVVAGFGVGFAAPHTYSTAIFKTIAAGSSGYFIIVVDVSATATAGNTIKVDGLANPVVFGFATGPSVTNNQTDIAGTQTIQSVGVTLSTLPVAASNIAQGSSNSIVYAVKMDVTSSPVTVNSIQFTLTGTHDNNDLTNVVVWFNAAASTVAGATPLVNVSGLFAAPHLYTLIINQAIAAGGSGYFIITVNPDAAATSGNTVKLNGAVNPVTFGFSTSPTITNNQTDAAGIQTILGAGITLTTSPVTAANIAQGSSNNIVYAVKMDVTTFPVAVNNIQFTLTGTHDNNDLTNVVVWFNAAAPSVSGATPLVNVSGLFAAPHIYSLSISQAIAAGGSGYFIITVTADAAATTGNTVKLNGAVNPVTFGFSTSPTITNNQTDATGIQTILGAGITLTTSAVTAANITQGSSNNIVYAVKMDVTSSPVTVNNIQFTLTGTHDNNDLTNVVVWFNASAPTVSGATPLVNVSGLFAAPHTYNIPIGQTIAAGGSGYFLVTVNLDAAATAGNTVLLNGAVNPVVFGFTTVPPVTNNQTNTAGAQTFISTLPLTLTSFTGSLIDAQQSFLQWTTAGELNTKDFDVEWSTDGVNFITIANLPAANSSVQNRQYGYTHKLPVDGNNYYRLKMNDRDGRFTYSAVVKIKIAVITTRVSVFPNPVADVLQLQVQAEKNQSIIFYLRAADGKTIASKSFAVIKGNNRVYWNVRQLAAGNYFITSASNSVETIKIIKQ